MFNHNFVLFVALVQIHKPHRRSANIQPIELVTPVAGRAGFASAWYHRLSQFERDGDFRAMMLQGGSEHTIAKPPESDTLALGRGAQCYQNSSATPHRRRGGGELTTLQS